MAMYGATTIQGVKQGNPLSPLLFLLYIEKFLFAIDDIAVSRGARVLELEKKSFEPPCMPTTWL